MAAFGGLPTHFRLTRAELCSQIMDLVPAAAAVVMQAILQHLPHKRFGKETHQLFLQSTFRVAEAPAGASVRDGLLLGVIDRLLEVCSRWLWLHCSAAHRPN